MTTPIKKTKVRQDNRRKPTAQDLHQQKATTPPAVNPTNAATPAVAGTTTPNHGSGYSAPDSPTEGESAPSNSLSYQPITNGGGDREIPQPNPPQETPVEDNPKM